jgi:sulfur carrier protein
MLQARPRVGQRFIPACTTPDPGGDPALYGVSPPSTRTAMKLILPDRTIRAVDPASAPVEEILLREGINPLDVMVTRNGRLVTEDTIVGGDDEIRLILISHGG